MLTDRSAGAPRLLHYGSALIPDWLDEAAATLSESPGLQGERTRHVRRRMADVVSLDALFVMEHPAMPSLCEMAATGQFDKEGSTGSVRVAVQRDFGGTDPQMSYAQSFSVAQFLAEVEGPAFIGHLATALAGGATMEEVLGHARKLPRTVAEIDRAWLAWLARGPRTCER